MATPRARRATSPAPSTETASAGPRIGWPGGPSRRLLLRFGARSALVCAVVGSLTMVASWHAGGLVRRGEIDRMLRMGASAGRQPAVTAKPSGRLDRGRMNALATAAAR